MSQLGMQMPGGQRRRPQMTVYTGLLFVAVVALACASGFVYLAAQEIGKDGNPFGMQEARDIKFAR
jgi:hypothetical protein